MKLGIYSDAGRFTCMHYPASLGKESLDANTFADWDVSFLKYDNCYSPPVDQVNSSKPHRRVCLRIMGGEGGSDQ